MKIIIASDIHGSFYYVNRLIEEFNRLNCDKLILLGDILYHGPRNDLPREYNPKKVINLLNQLKDKILCVRGNCDAEVDSMVLAFPVLTPNRKIKVDGKVWHLTHGHKYNLSALPPMKEGDILLHGHTHIPACETRDGITYLNPGSVSIPKENSAHSYMIFENGVFTNKSLDGETVFSFSA